MTFPLLQPKLLAPWFGILLLGLLPAGAAAGTVARVIAIQGIATATPPGETPQPLAKGSLLDAGVNIVTQARASLTLEFTDGSRLTLGPLSRFTIRDYEAAEGRESFITRVSQGSFRFVTGRIARRKPKAVRLETVVATIGVRGTHFGGEMEGESARVVLLEPEETGRSTAIEVWNDYGRVVIDQPGWGTEIPDASSPPSPPRRMRLQSITNLMRSLQTIQRLPRPRPRLP